MMLDKMIRDAEGGGVYFLESHETTLPLGWVQRAWLDQEPGGDRSLYADVVLDSQHPLVPVFIRNYESGKYVPDCSVGLKVVKGTIYDPDEGGFVGYLLDGFWEHLAMTKPGRPAYPDAGIAENYYRAEDMRGAFKAILVSVGKDIEAAQRAANQDQSAEGRKGEEEMQSPTLKIRAADAAGLETKNKDADAEARKAKEAEAEAKKAADAEAAKAKEAEAEAEAKKAKDAEAEATKAKEAEAEACKAKEAEAEANKKKEADAEAEANKEAANKEAARKAAPGKLKAHISAMRDMMKKGMDEGVSEAEFRALMKDMSADADLAVSMADELAGAEVVDKTKGDLHITHTDHPEPDADDKKKEADAEAKKAKDAEAEAEARKAKEAEAKKEADAKKAKDAEAEAAHKSADSAVERLAGLVEGLTKNVGDLVVANKALVDANKEMNEKLEHLDKKPAANGGPRRFSDPTGLAARLAGGQATPETLQTSLKEMPQGKERELASMKIAEAVIGEVLSRSGLASKG